MNKKIAAMGICLLLLTQPVLAQEAVNGQDNGIFPDSQFRLITEEEVVNLGLTADDIRIAKNEIYARHGYTFEDENLQSYFLQKSWYTPIYRSVEFKDSWLNAYERTNAALLEYVLQNMSETETLPSPQENSTISYSMQPTTVIDMVGVGDYAYTLSASVRNDFETYTQLNTNSNYAMASEFYVKDGQIFGNIGFYKTAQQSGSGQSCTWFNQKEYVEVLESQEDTDSFYMWETFGLYANGERVAVYAQKDSHESASRNLIYWLVTDYEVYVGGYGKMDIYPMTGNSHLESESWIRPLAVTEAFVYWHEYHNDNGIIKRSPRNDFSQSEIILSDVRPESCAGDILVYEAKGNWYSYNLATNQNTYLQPGSNWQDIVTDGEFIYILIPDDETRVSTVYRMNVDGTDIVWVAEITGLSYSRFLQAEDDILFFEGYVIDAQVENSYSWIIYGASTGETEWINKIYTAIDLKNTDFYILEAHWES